MAVEADTITLLAKVFKKMTPLDFNLMYFLIALIFFYVQLLLYKNLSAKQNILTCRQYTLFNINKLEKKLLMRFYERILICVINLIQLYAKIQEDFSYSMKAKIKKKIAKLI